MAAAPYLHGCLGHLEDALLDMVQRGEALVLRVAAVLADGAPIFVVIWSKMNINRLESLAARAFSKFSQLVCLGRLSQTNQVMENGLEHD